MSRSSCISEPENEPLILVKQWMVDISIDEKGKANHCAATLIGFFKYFHEVKIEIAAKNRIANDVAEKHGEKRVHDESLYQFHTIEDLGERLLGFFSKNTIRSAISLLVEKGIIKTFANPNPRHKFDKTTFFLFSPKNCKELLKNRRKTKPETIESQNWNIDGSELTDRYSKNDPTSSKSDPAIPKTTSKTTEEEAKQKIYQDGIAHDQQKPIESAADNFLDFENETENHNTHCQAQLPVTEQSSVVAAAEKPVDHVSVVDAEQMDEAGTENSVVEPCCSEHVAEALPDQAVKANNEGRPHVTDQDNAKAQHGDVAQESGAQPSAKPTQRTSHRHSPAKPVGHKPSNAKATNVVEPVIGKSLTDGQMAALVRLVESINTSKPELGVTVQDLERTILNPRAFKECRNQFLKKCNTIKKMALAGRWSPIEAKKPSANRSQWSPDLAAARHSVAATVSGSTNPAVMAHRHRESSDGRIAAIQSSIASIKATFTDCMARFRDEFFFSVQREKIAKLEEELRQLGAGTPDVTEFPVSNGFDPDQRHAVGGAK